MKPISLEDRIVAHLEADAERPLKMQEIARELDVPDGELQELTDALARLETDGRVYRGKHEQYALPEQINLVVGRMDTTRKGAGFVVPDRKTDEPDLFVPRHKMEGAVHGDRVVARIERRKREGNPEGSVVRVLQRARSEIVGTLQQGKRFGFVVPDNRRLSFDVYVAAEDLAQAKEGDKVVVAIDAWGDGAKSPEGRVIEVLGAPDAPGVDILSIVRSHGLDPEFPEDVERAAHEIDLDMKTEAARRLDLRDRAIFTIDPVDAKDFDDALSVKKAGDGLLEIGIHIADVSHFVRPGTAIDEEARERGTSVYLVDRVIPMLPERLSNQLCSLVPGEDRLAYSVILTIDESGTVRNYRIAETVIRSRHRLTYAQAQAMIDGAPDEKAHEEIMWEIQTLRKLAVVLQGRRAKRGSLDFDLPEAIVELDEEGFPTDIKESVRLESMRLIEEFMLLANETVARHATGLKVPFVYRVHDRPDPEKLERIRGLVAAMGHVLPKAESGMEPRAFADLLQEVKGSREEQLVNTVVLRSMKQARYQVENVGHFGLAAENYSHFTSPIRRYPDLEVHRLLKRIEQGERWKGEDVKAAEVTRLESVTEHSSRRERVAVEAERDSVDLKKVEFMERHVGEEFDATISGVTSFGFFVRLVEYYVEGLVHMHQLDDDYYEFREDQYALLGRNKGRRFRLADPVRVRVVQVDKAQRQIDFELVEPEAKPGEAATATGAAGRRKGGGKGKEAGKPAGSGGRGGGGKARGGRRSGGRGSGKSDGTGGAPAKGGDSQDGGAAPKSGGAAPKSGGRAPKGGGGRRSGGSGQKRGGTPPEGAAPEGGGGAASGGGKGRRRGGGGRSKGGAGESGGGRSRGSGESGGPGPKGSDGAPGGGRSRGGSRGGGGRSKGPGGAKRG